MFNFFSIYLYMSSNRLIYEPCAYEAAVKQSTDPLKYITSVDAYENSKRCGSKVEFGNRADIESELRGQSRLQSNCPSKKYNPGEMAYQVADKNYSPPDACSFTTGHHPGNSHKQVMPCDAGFSGSDASFCQLKK